MKNPMETIDHGNMGLLQIFIVFITVLLNAIDGFDVLSISFAAPGIAREWGITPAALGVVMSMEIVGMSIGSFFLGGVADRYGRRPTLLWCLVAMTGGMLLVPTSANVTQLCLWRVLVGLGIGGILACVNAVVAEFSNIRRRGMCISIMVIGYPVGGTLGGMAASHLLSAHDWRIIFYFGAILTGLLIPLVFFFVPESVHWLARKQPASALEKINKALARMGLPAAEGLPDVQVGKEKPTLAGIFAPDMLRTTLVLTSVYFLHITTFYFVMKWSPKIVADMGFHPSLAGQALVCVSLGGALGAALFGWLTHWIELKKLTIGILVLTSVFVAVFGRTSADMGQIKLLAGLAGFFGNAGISGLYSLLAISFPTDLRATGTGFVIGLGRAGAVVSPILAGILLQAGATLPAVSMTMGLGAFLGGTILLLFKMTSE